MPFIPAFGYHRAMDDSVELSTDKHVAFGDDKKDGKEPFQMSRKQVFLVFFLRLGVKQVTFVPLF